MKKKASQEEKESRFNNIYKKMDMKADYIELHWLLQDLKTQNSKLRTL